MVSDKNTQRNIFTIIFLCSFHKGIIAKDENSLLTQKCGDVINTQQARRSEWNETRDLLGFNTRTIGFRTKGVPVNLTLQLTRRENLISSLRSNMSVLHQTVPNIWLDSQFNEAIDQTFDIQRIHEMKIFKLGIIG